MVKHLDKFKIYKNRPALVEGDIHLFNSLAEAKVYFGVQELAYKTLDNNFIRVDAAQFKTKEETKKAS